MHILLAVADPTLIRSIQRHLTREHHVVEIALDGEDALRHVFLDPYDCIIVSAQLPKMDGIRFCTTLRREGIATPILLLSPASERSQLVEGLDGGADDCLLSPFDWRELSARVRCLLRRGSGPREPVLSFGSLILDPNCQQVFSGSARVTLAPKEYALLEYLLRNRGSARDRTEILTHVWGGGDRLFFSRTLEVHVAYLRRKIGRETIRTVPGKGYMVPA